MEFTGGKGVDVLLEMLANVNLGKDLTIMAPKGRVVVIGSRGTVEIDPRDIMSREVDVLGVMSGLATEEERIQTYTAVEKGLAEGTLCPIIAERISLTEAARAHREVIEKPRLGKIVMIP